MYVAIEIILLDSSGTSYIYMCARRLSKFLTGVSANKELRTCGIKWYEQSPVRCVMASSTFVEVVVDFCMLARDVEVVACREDKSASRELSYMPR